MSQVNVSEATLGARSSRTAAFRLTLLGFIALAAAQPAYAQTLDLIEGADDPVAEITGALLAPSSQISIVPGSEVFVGRVGDGIDPNLAQSATYIDLSLVSSTGGPTITNANGVLLTSGVGNVPTSNTDGSFQNSDVNTPNPGTGGDAEITQILIDAGAVGVGTIVNDVNSITFDFTVPDGFDGVTATFVFGSDEFPNQPVTDVFVVIVDGVNYAMFQDGSLVSFVQGVNAANFNDNDFNDGGPTPYDIEYDGISNRLTVAGALDPELDVHTIKIAIGDTQDTSFDSAVFIGALKVCVVGQTCTTGVDPVVDENPPICQSLGQDGDPFFGFATDNRPSEDTNGNMQLDGGEDQNGNGLIDEDSGIASVELIDDPVNFELTIENEFTPGDPSVSFRVDRVDPQFTASAVVQVTDVAGNTCEFAPIMLEGANIVSDPVQIIGWPEAVQIDDDKENLYIAMQDQGVDVHDITDRANGMQIANFNADASQCPDGFFADEILLTQDDFEEDIAGVSGGICGPVALDITDPENPAFLGRAFIEGALVEELAIGSDEDDFVYAASFWMGLQILEVICDVEQGGCLTAQRGGIGAGDPDWGKSVAVWVETIPGDGEDQVIAYVAATEGLQIVDATDPDNPTLLGRLDTNPTDLPLNQLDDVPQDVVVAGDFAYVPLWIGGLIVVDVSDPTNPVEIQRINAAEGSAFFKVEISSEIENRVYATEGLAGLAIFARFPNGALLRQDQVPIGEGDERCSFDEDGIADICWAWSVDEVDEVVAVGYGVLDTPLAGGYVLIDQRFGCGLIGIEPFMLLAPLYWRRWRRRRTN